MPPLKHTWLLTKRIQFILFFLLLVCQHSLLLSQADNLLVLSPAKNQFITADGYIHPLRQWLPATQARAIMIALHGFNDYSNAFTLPAPELTQAGIMLFAYDQRGFGATAGRGLWHGGATLASDLLTFIHLIHNHLPDLPIYLLGESMGGAVILKAQSLFPLPVSGIILVAPAILSPHLMPWYQQITWRIVSTLFPWLLVSGDGLDIHPSDNIAMLKELSRDPLIIKETRIDTLDGLVYLMDEAHAAIMQNNIPMLVLYGQKDEIIPPEAMVSLRQYTQTHPMHQWQEFDNSFHMLLRDQQRHLVLSALLAWIDAHSPPPTKEMTP